MPIARNLKQDNYLFFKPTRALADSLRTIVTKALDNRNLLYLLQIFVIIQIDRIGLSTPAVFATDSPRRDSQISRQTRDIEVVKFTKTTRKCGTS
jgi:hypothetical protein